ncbi:MAG TPA: hypothetical protein VKR21_16540 [Solirubrobacteraceae bacterium]|nr:hypothetical protein [Solirubrobacteraceae bacterium]
MAGSRDDPVTAATGPAGSQSPAGVATLWARRWPYATATVTGITISFATIAILAALIPAAPPVVGWIGYLAGVAVGTLVAGLKGARGWVVAPIITLAIALVLGGILALSGVHLP